MFIYVKLKEGEIIAIRRSQKENRANKNEKKRINRANEELRKKENEILCCIYIWANGEQDRNVNEPDIIKEVNLRYNTNCQSDLPENVMQYLANNGFIKRGEFIKDSVALTKEGRTLVVNSSICDN